MNKLTSKALPVLVCTALLAMSTNASANPCKSTWQKLNSNFKALGPMARDLGCVAAASASDGSVDAKTCQKTVNDVTKEINIWAKKYNSVNTNQGKIGPRGCVPATNYTGTVLAERTFVCTPVLEKNWKLNFSVTGGKGKKDLKVDVCLIDGKGNAKVHRNQVFKGAKKSKGKSFKSGYFKNATGLIPVIYLHKKAGVNGYKYKLKGTEKGGKPKL